MSVAGLVLNYHAPNGKSKGTLEALCEGRPIAVERVDLSDAVERQRMASLLRQRVPTLDSEALTQELMRVACPPEPQLNKEDKAPRKTQATAIIELVEEAGVELWHQGDTGYVTILTAATDTDAGHREHWPIRGRQFKRWLGRQYYVVHNSSPSAQPVQDALTVLEGKALFDGAEYPIALRTAEHEGHVYLDLCNRQWQAVQVTSAGWRIVDDPPVRFRRAKAMLSLPLPVAGGSVDSLRLFANVSDGDWPLLLAWLLSALRPRGPYPTLCLHGEQGSAKSTTGRLLRELIDPNQSPLRCEPREPRDLAIAANNGWVIALDNVSYLHNWLSDALCRLSTGGGFATRELYSNDDETIFDCQRPVVLNGIEEIATRGDLLDRSLLLHLPAIAEAARLPESQLWPRFKQEAPAILGAVLTAVSGALRNLSETHLSRLPRMADFALWACAGEHGLGLTPGDFLRAYASNRAGAHEVAVEASAVARMIMEMMTTTSAWTGTASDLLAELDQRADERTKRQRGWPASPKALAGTVKRLAPSLRALGVEVEIGRTKRGRFITLTRMGTDSCVTTVTSVTTPENQGSTGDAR